MNVEPPLDLGPDGEGFIESVTVGSQVKSGQTNKKARMSLPLVGLAGGLAGGTWAASWLTLRETRGLDAALDGCLMPIPLKDGGF